MRSTTCASIRKRPSNKALKRTPNGAAELHAAHHNNPTGVKGILGTRSVYKLSLTFETSCGENLDMAEKLDSHQVVTFEELLQAMME